MQRFSAIVSAFIHFPERMKSSYLFQIMNWYVPVDSNRVKSPVFILSKSLVYIVYILLNSLVITFNNRFESFNKTPQWDCHILHKISNDYTAEIDIVKNKFS